MTKQLFAKAATIVMIFAASLLGMSSALAQNTPIRGTVVDSGNQPVIGAAVMVPGTTTGATTNIDGKFELRVAPGTTLEVSCIGYTSKRVAAANGMTVVLEDDTEMLEETVVIGYGVQRKSDLTGSVASVRQAELMDRSTTDAAAALQGKAAGVQIFNASGAPGEGASIRVRGVSSNGSQGLGPLLIVDGLKVDNIQYLDPSMIESMEVLKDAASAAIYGAQAGNGVVLITTKSGAASKGKDGNIFYNYKMNLSILGKKAEVMNADQYIDWNTQAGNFTRESAIENGWWDGKTVTDWASVLFGPSVSHNHTFGAQGGNDRGNYFVSLSYADQDGMVVGNKDYYKRFTAQVNADYKIKSWFQVGTNTSIERYTRGSVSEHSEYSNGDNGTSLLGALIIDPLTPVYYTSMDQMAYDLRAAAEGIKRPSETTYYKVYKNEDGYYYATSRFQEGDGGNPLVFRDRANSKSEGWNIRGTVFANLTPIKGLVITSRLGYRIAQSYSSNFVEPYFLNPKLYADNYKVSATSSQNYYYQWENFANYNVTLARKHAIGAMVGMSYTYQDRRAVGVQLEGKDPLKGYEENFRYISQDNGSGTKTFSGTSDPNQSTQISYFGRLSYSYDNRYSIQTNFRADAFDSSKLSTKNRWGFFPSVSAGWTISNENFIKDNVSKDVLSFLKLRASWGQNGNIAVLSGYPYSTTIDYNSKQYQWGIADPSITNGSAPSGLANPDLKWETSEQLDLGLDARFLNNRLTLGIDWYNKDTKDLLMNVNPVYEVGISSTTINAGSINNRGLEFELGWQDTVGDFHYSVNANFSTLSNKVTYMNKSGGERIKGAEFSNFKMKTYFEEGYPVWYIRGFEYAGVGDAGQPLYYDKDGKVTDSVSDDDLKFVGSGIPTYNYGITIRADWKGLDLTIFGTGAGGNVIMPCVYRTEHPKINSLAYFYENAGKTLPTIKNMYDNVSFWSSSANLFKGDYFKIKQIQLGYSLPKNIAKKILLSNLRVYVSLDDFFTFTKYPGFDPETASTGSYNGMGLDKGSYPNSRKLLVGVNITF